MGSQADSRQIVKSILSNMKSLFLKSTRGARERVWEKLWSDRGKNEIRRLINNPSMGLNKFDVFLTFKEENLITFKEFLLYQEDNDDKVSRRNKRVS